MEAQSALVGANGAVKLYAVANVDLHLALVVNPGYAEGGDALRLNESLNDFRLLKFRMLVIDVFDGDEDFFYRLQELCLAWMLALQLLHDVLYVHSF